MKPAPLLTGACPRCRRTGVSDAGNGLCVRCDDQTSYAYCSPRPVAVVVPSKKRGGK